MDQRQRACHPFIAQIGVIGTDLIGQQHALVADRAGRQRGYVEMTAIRLARFAHGILDTLANHEQGAFEGVSIGTACRAAHQYLAHDGFHGFDAFTQTTIVGWHITPAK